MKFKHVIWDWNGTLVDDIALSVSVFNTLMRDNGLGEVEKSTYVEKFKIPVRDFYEELGFDFSKKSFREVGEYYIAEYNSRRFECDLYAGARICLHSLSEAGVGQSVLSAYEKNHLLSALSHYGIDKIFTAIAGLENIDAGSKVEVGKAHVMRLGINPKDAVMIGDTVHDKQTADAMGVACALISTGHNSRRRLEKTGAPVFDTHAQLLDFLHE